ncbi:hypothetical protein CEXT_328891 [Caerostris extrusa]|uniref:Gustatory receptor n=1 Tax=Caerostris extrusa TaxID=172846 RepID=A0AAV4U295_CAEEX|nr:hypothetical protein CEXT_328891 [Caerostris extrusa]
MCALVSLFGLASEFPSATTEIGSRFQQLYQSILLEDQVFLSLKHLMLVKALSEIKPFYLTANGLFRIDKTMILSLLGCALSFGILIMQLKTFDAGESLVAESTLKSSC